MSEARGSRKPILFFTNSEHGQANVVLAVAYEFLLRGEFDVHIASYPVLAPRIEHLNELLKSRKGEENGFIGSGRREGDGEKIKAAEESSFIPTATFQPILAMSMTEVVGEKKSLLPHPPGISAAVKSYSTLMDVFFGFERAQYMVGFDSCSDIIKKVNPSAIISDSAMFWAIDAANMLKKECAILSPLSFKDMVGVLQPRMAVWWKYPQLSSGFPYPLSWHHILGNIYLTIRLIKTFVFGDKVAGLNQYRKENGLKGNLPSSEPYRANRLQLCPSLPELDFPLSYIPDNAVGCGPIVMPADPVSESDPELASWLKNGPPVVLINLGSHIVSDPDAGALEIAKGLRIVLDRFPGTRFLWKLKYKWAKSDKFYQILATEIESGQVRILDWLVSDPVSILDTGKIICSVNHGGANSFYEACRAGIPQLILPVWWDTYEFAARAEWLGIGARGNHSSAPGAEASEFARALTQALGEEGMKTNAKEIGRLCRKVEGREFACERLSDWARGIA